MSDLIHQLKGFGLGLKRKTVELHQSAQGWNDAFVWLENRLEDYQIHHIGSTSFGEIKAKPILDAMVVLGSLDDVKPAVQILESEGFTYKGDILSRLYGQEEQATRHFFSCYDADNETDFVHLHMLVEGHPDIQKHLTFRDKMRAHPNLRKSYEDLKLDLKARDASRREYMMSKSNFIAAVVMS